MIVAIVETSLLMCPPLSEVFPLVAVLNYHQVCSSILNPVAAVAEALATAVAAPILCCLSELVRILKLVKIVTWSVAGHLVVVCNCY